MLPLRSLLHFMEVISLTDHYGPRLKHLHLCLEQTITEAVSAMDLTAAQGQILSFISHQPQPPCPKDIEDAFHLRHPTVSGLLARLEKKEFIAIRADEDDRRCKRIHLTAKGEACHRQIHTVIDETEAYFVRNFTAEERAEFSRLLNKATANMGSIAPLHCPKEECSK